MIAVILAAGKGTRMHPFSVQYPKPALPVCNTPLLQYQIEMFRDQGVTEIIMVIGHLGHEIVQVFGDGSRLGVSIRYVEQAKLLGIAAALGQLESLIHTPFFMVLGDIFFKYENISSMIEILREKNASAVLAVKDEPHQEAIKRNFTVLQNDDGTVRRVIEKPRHVITRVKGCGLYLFDLPVFDAVRRTPRTAMRDEYEITDTIQIMVDDGLPVYTAEVITWDINLTYPADVLRCNLYELEYRGETVALGENTDIHPGAQLTRAVVGDNVAIRHPIKVNRAVIFPGTVVTSEHDIEDFILTPEHQIDCRMFF